MILIDRLLRSGIGFVLDKVASAADAELNDTSALRNQLMEAQMRLELGEIDQAEYDGLEATLLTRMRELLPGRDPGDARIIGAEAHVVVGHEDES